MLVGKSLSASEHDAVHHNQRDEQSEGLVNTRYESLHQELKQSHEGRNHNDIDRDMHLVRYDRSNQRNHDIGEDEHEHSRKSHLQSVHCGSSGGECRTHTEHQHECRVVLYKPVSENGQFAHLRTSLLLSDLTTFTALLTASA